MKYKPHIINAKVVKDVSTGDEWYVSEEFADFLKEHFSELLEGKSFVVCFAGKDMEVEYVTTAQYLADYPQQAARPANSVLENYMFKMTNGYMFASWEDAIKEYMKTLV